MPKPSSAADPVTAGKGGSPDGAPGSTLDGDRFELDPAAPEPTSHRGLVYPFGKRVPEPGELIPVAPGIGWTRLPMPGSLKHINIYTLDDVELDGVAVVDTGIDSAASRGGWEALLAGPLAGRRITRVIVTHFHPDHLGLAGWLCARFDAPLLMTRTEWLWARMLTLDLRDAPPGEAAAYQRAAGWDEERIDRETAKGWGRFASAVTPVPVSYLRMQEGDVLRVGTRAWRVVIGSGHSPEHACLVDEAGGVMIAGDQVLPRITSNVSLALSEPDGDPLGDWLTSIDRLKALPRDLLVLPGHGEPFTGLHARLDALAAGHHDRLDALAGRLAERPQRAVDVFGLLFGRKVDDNVYGLATGEALAHLRYLEVQGRAVREVRDGVHWFRAR